MEYAHLQEQSASGVGSEAMANLHPVPRIASLPDLSAF